MRPQSLLDDWKEPRNGVNDKLKLGYSRMDLNVAVVI